MHKATVTTTALAVLLGLTPIDAARAGGIVPGDVELTALTSNLTGPLAARHAGDGSGRLFVVEQGGAVRIWDGTQILSQPFMNIADRITTSGNEQGLLGLAFHPNFESNGLLYVNYSAGGTSPFANGTTVVSEFQVDAADPNDVDESTERVILTVVQDFSNHNGGDVHFGPDGYLYIGMGDGGSGNDPCFRAQTLDPANIMTGGGCENDESVALLGKMLRIDVDNTTPAGSNQLCGDDGTGAAEYAIPADNPFAGDDADNACDEVWAYGLRNPFRFSFDRSTGDLLIGDVGQNVWEEIDFEPAASPGGVNYGWDFCEGDHDAGTTGPGCTFPSEAPILEYQHASGRCSVEGGYRYRGPVASLYGLYIYGDFCTGEIFFGRENSPGDWQSAIFDTVGFGLTAFGEDEQGNVYVTRQGGTLYRFDGDTEVILTDGFEDT